MTNHIGLFSTPKNLTGLREDKKTKLVGAKRHALRPRATVLFNLINRTKVGSFHE